MGELKGQLLSLLTVLVIFGAIAGSLYAAFNIWDCFSFGNA